MILYENVLKKAKDFVVKNKGKLAAAASLAALAGGAAYAYNKGAFNNLNLFNTQPTSDNEPKTATGTQPVKSGLTADEMHQRATFKQIDNNITEPKTATGTQPVKPGLTADEMHQRATFKQIDNNITEPKTATGTQPVKSGLTADEMHQRATFKQIDDRMSEPKIPTADDLVRTAPNIEPKFVNTHVPQSHDPAKPAGEDIMIGDKLYDKWGNRIEAEPVGVKITNPLAPKTQPPAPNFKIRHSYSYGLR